MIPEITVTQLAEKLKSDEKFILLDVCKLSELAQARIEDSRLEVTPTSRLASEGLDALSEAVRSQEIPVYILCHHGNRSMQVTTWLMRYEYKNIFNVRGGIDAYCAAAARVMAPAGRFVLCAAARDDARMRAGAAAAQLGIVA